VLQPVTLTQTNISICLDACNEAITVASRLCLLVSLAAALHLFALRDSTAAAKLYSRANNTQAAAANTHPPITSVASE
jgi:hypothetical protein